MPTRRPRRLRRTPALRRLVAETRLGVDDLIAPLFVREGIGEPQPIASLPGVVQHTRESLRKEVAGLAGRLASAAGEKQGGQREGQQQRKGSEGVVQKGTNLAVIVASPRQKARACGQTGVCGP